MIKKTVFCILFILAFAFSPAGLFANEKASLRIILSGDMPELKSSKGRGGYAKLSTVIQNEKAGSKHSIFVHAGDAYSPSLLAGMDKGKSSVHMLNAIGVDYMVLGNHEWDFGPKNIR